MTDKRYTKVEEEVIQILDRMEHEQPFSQKPRLTVLPPASTRRRKTLLRRPDLRRRPSWAWLATSFTVAGLAYLMRDTSSTVALFLAILSAGIFFGPLFSKSSASLPVEPGAPTTKTWRGKDITFSSPPQDDVSHKARRWLSDRRRGPRNF